MESERETFGGAALVTGASAGIGEAFARALAARKLDVILVARREDKLEALARELSASHGVRTLAVSQNLSEAGAAEAVRKAVDAAGMSVGMLVNNAGFGAYGRFEAQDAERDAAMVDLNCRAVVSLTHTFLPDMLKRKKGAIIFVSSISAFQPTPYFAVYGATKAFDLMLAEALWAELSPSGISVLGVCPGYVPTEFQQHANSEVAARGAGTFSAEEIVGSALKALGRQPSIICDTGNFLLCNSARLAPRAVVARLAERLNRPAEEAAPARQRTPATVSSGRFQHDVARMLLTFAAVVAIDFGALSLFTGHLRFWFPVWLDPHWATRSAPWVVYSQSYFAGIFCIPLLAAAVAREFLARAQPWVRTLYWGVALGTLGFIAWWKGGLMVQYGKHQEALAWLALSGLVYGLIGLAQSLPSKMASVTRGALLAGLTRGVAGFFLVMALIDPFLQLVVQRVNWSTGLAIEMGFFIPAGLCLLWASRRISREEPA